VQGARIDSLQIASPFVLRTVEPSVASLAGQTVTSVERLGKRVVIGTSEATYLVIHLMIAGRFHWFDADSGSSADSGTESTAGSSDVKRADSSTGSSASGNTGASAHADSRTDSRSRSRKKPPAGKQLLAAIRFSTGTLYLTEAGSKRRASIYLLGGRTELDAMNPGGLEVLEADRDSFIARVREQNHTLKRTLTDPRILSGIGNAYSNEILHRARLSPMLLSQKVDDDVLSRLYNAIRDVLDEWIVRLRDARNQGDGFPDKVTAFRPDMAVHGQYNKPCPVCDSPVQRIVYANNETNYCASCQTGGVVLKDRALSRLLKDSWPSRLES